MTLLRLRCWPDPILKKKSKPVEKVDNDTRKLMDDMLETMYHCKGIGLAAVQVGILKRILIMDVNHSSSRYENDNKNNQEQESTPLFMINPQISWHSKELNSYDEGCLSFPEQFSKVERPAQIKVSYLDYNGQKQLLEADNLLATCTQHEIDHLNGITFIDHISRLKREIILKKLRKNS